MKTPYRFKKKRQRGAAMVEFAIVALLLILILFGTIEFGLLLFNKQVITNASREGARFGIVAASPRKTETEIKDVVKNYLGECDGCKRSLVTFGTPNLSSTSVTFPADTSFGNDLTVTVTYPYTFLVLSNMGFGPVTLQARTVMKYE